MKGSPALSTRVGDKVTRGRLPGATTFGLFASVTADCKRSLIRTPVSPATTAGSQAPLGVALNRLPSLSTTLTQVVSWARSWSGTFDRCEPVFTPLARTGFRVKGSPGRSASDALDASIRGRRTAA